jgi:hypothetical protein
LETEVWQEERATCCKMKFLRSAVGWVPSGISWRAFCNMLDVLATGKCIIHGIQPIRFDYESEGAISHLLSSDFACGEAVRLGNLELNLQHRENTKIARCGPPAWVSTHRPQGSSLRGCRGRKWGEPRGKSAARTSRPRGRYRDSALQVDAASEASIERGLELLHLLPDLAQFLRNGRDLPLDLARGGTEHFLRLRQRERDERVSHLVSGMVR